MPTSTRTFRVFVSSTFNDLKAERNALQENVFRRMRDLAMKRRCRFQVIDLRWGVSEEAGLDQRTMKICLDEVERCQKISPRPNFIILLGNRFGWRPLPYAIPADEFERLLPHLSKSEHFLACWREDQPEDAQGWYRLDENAVPPEYVLLPRQPGSSYADYAVWENQVERPLVSALERAARLAGLDEDELAKYSLSATGQEIAKGAMQTLDAREHVFCYFREIDGLPQDNGGCDFHDADPAAAVKQDQLKARLKQQLPGNVHGYTASWQGQGPTLDHLEALCEAVYNDLSRVMLLEMAQLEAVDPLSKENAAHDEFGSERARNFIGRAEALKTIAGYIAGRNSQPQVIWGASGSGKSALMARAVQEARQMHPQAVILTRFISATPGSSNGRALLEDLCRQITRIYKGDESAIPTEYRELVEAFPRRLALANASKPLIIFLDALDQLSAQDQADQLAWLPVNLPEGVHMILSILPGMPLERLMNRLPSRALVQVEPMSLLEGVKILDAWLHGANRCLTEVQRGDILAKFTQCGGLPLYLKLAFEEARRWRSFDGLPFQSDQLPGLSADIPGILHDLFWRLEQESNHGHELVAKALGYLVAARNGLSEDEILDVLWADPDVQADFFRRSPKSPQDIQALPVVIWSRLYLDLEPYLAWREADGTELLGFYHRQVAEAVQERIDTEGKKGLHHSLESYYAGQQLWFDADRRIANPRKISELPYQQAYAGLGKDLVATLTHFDFLHATLQATNPQVLIDNFGLYQAPEANVPCESAKSLGLINRALMLSSFSLARNKDLLAGQLIGRLGDLPQPEILALVLSAGHWTDRPWLRPISTCLPPPGEPLIRTLGEHGGVEWIQITPDGKRAISSSNQLKIWDLANGRCEQVIGEETVRKSFAIASSLDRYKVATTSIEWDGTVKSNLGILEILDFETGQRIKHFGSHKNPITSVAITPEGTRAFTASYVYKSKDNTIKVWDIEGSRCTMTIKDDAEKVLISSDGRRGIAMKESWPSSGLKLWNLESGKRIRLVEDFQGPHLVRITPDGCRIVYLVSQGRGLKVMDLNSGKDLFLLEGPSSGMRSFGISPNGKLALAESVVIRNQQGFDTLQIWDLDAGKCIRVLEGIKGILAIFPDGEKALDRWLRIWDLRSGICLRQVSPQHYEARLISIAPDGTQAVSFSDNDNAIRQWDLEKDREPETYTGHAGATWATALVPGIHQVVSSSEDKTLKIWDLKTGRHLSDLTGHSHLVRCVSTTPDGRHLISGSDDHTLRIWDLHANQCLHTLWSSKGQPIFAISVSPDGQQILSGASNTLDLWDLRRDKPMRTFLGLHKDTVKWTAITPDGCLGISASNAASGDEVFIWDLHKRCLLRSLACQRFSFVAMLPDGKRLLLLEGDNLNVWDLESGECLHTISAKDPQGRIAGMVVVEPDGRQVVVVSWSALRVFDLETGDLVLMSNRKEGFIPTSGVALADGKHMFAGFDDGLVEIWDLESGTQLTEFIGEGKFFRGKAVISDHTIFYGDQTGRVYFLSLENICLGPSIITAWRNELDAHQVAFGCTHCRTWSEAPMSVLGTIVACPSCDRLVKLNPFTIDADWRPIARVWKLYE